MAMRMAVTSAEQLSCAQRRRSHKGPHSKSRCQERTPDRQMSLLHLVMSLQVAKAVASSIQKLGDSEVAVGKAKYFKQVCHFHGLKSAALKSAVQEHLPTLKQLYSSEGKPSIHEICKILILSKYHEEKAAVPLIMNLVLDKKPSRLSLDDLHFLGSEVFDAGHAFDWATVDTLCGQVIHNVLIHSGNSSTSVASQTLLEWAKNPKGPAPLWKQRAACVAFVKLARHGDHSDVIFDIADVCVRNSERFVQLGVGWVLRELWLAEPHLVLEFITDRYTLFSREGLRYAIEKMDSSTQQRLLRYDPMKDGKLIADGKAQQTESRKSGSAVSVASVKREKKRAAEAIEEEEMDEGFKAPRAKKPKTKSL